MVVVVVLRTNEGRTAVARVRVDVVVSGASRRQQLYVDVDGRGVYVLSPCPKSTTKRSREFVYSCS